LVMGGEDVPWGGKKTYIGARGEISSRDAPVALVTGGARKLGASISRHLVRAGYRVVIDYRQSHLQAKKLVSRIREGGGDAIRVQADVTRDRDVRRMFQTVECSYGRLDVLVNNVGDYLEKPLASVSLSEWDDILRSNLYSVFLCTREALPMMRRAGAGRVVNIGYAPVGKVVSSRKCAVYHLAKLGALSLTKAFAGEEAKNGITVNMISPGTLFNSVKKPSKNPKDYIPAGRFCRYRDIHGMLDYLLGAHASYVTGGHFVLSGGYGI
jgi:3-oxoacyl-[acyl-carrier protein] reductase